MNILTRGGFALPGSSLQFKTGDWRTERPVHRHRAAPCHGACPSGEDAQAWLARLADGDERGAWETLVGANPMPAITGRVCHHPCESACNRGRYDEPIAINHVERFLGDYALVKDWDYPVVLPAPTAPRAAVVGAGPAGISAAYHLTRRGYRVSLFEALSEPGGTLATAIPAYRLPRDVLDAELSRILTLGIDFRPLQRLGRDMSVDELIADYGAVFLAPGTVKSRVWSVDGVTPRDLRTGLEMLKQWMDVGSVPVTRSAAIVGGGNTAVDLARVLKRAGVEEVHIITHQDLPGGEDEMRAIPREIEQALEEGVAIHARRGIRRLILRGERIVGLELVHMKKMTRADGRVQKVAFEGTETVLHVDQVIPAIGQEVDPQGMEALLAGNSFFQADAWGGIGARAGVFVGGDARGDRGTVSAAIGDGGRAACAMDAFLRGETLPPPAVKDVVPFEAININYFEPAARAKERALPVHERQDFVEVERGLAENQAHAEAARCFSCGNCFACDNCWTLCPDIAVLKGGTETDIRYLFDYEYCKGCGICAHECPCGHIAMESEL